MPVAQIADVTFNGLSYIFTDGNLACKNIRYVLFGRMQLRRAAERVFPVAP